MRQACVRLVTRRFTTSGVFLAKLGPSKRRFNLQDSCVERVWRIQRDCYTGDKNKVDRGPLFHRVFQRSCRNRTALCHWGSFFISYSVHISSSAELLRGPSEISRTRLENWSRFFPRMFVERDFLWWTAVGILVGGHFLGDLHSVKTSLSAKRWQRSVYTIKLVVRDRTAVLY